MDVAVTEGGGGEVDPLKDLLKQADALSFKETKPRVTVSLLVAAHIIT